MNPFARGNIQSAITSVRLAKWRSLLTMMGVIIGIVSVVTVVGLGEGIKHQVLQQINQLGKNLIVVRPGASANNGHNPLLGNLGQLANIHGNGVLSSSDIHTMSGTKNVQYAVPLSTVGGAPTYDNRHAGTVIGTTENFPKLVNQSIAYGSFFSDDEGADNVAVIGAHVARDLFGEDVPLGSSFSFAGQQFVVRGIFNEFSSAPLSIDTDFNNAIFIPYRTAQQLTSQHNTIYQVLVKPADAQHTDATITALQSNLRSAHGGQNDFSVQRQTETLHGTTAILNLFTDFIGGVAAISLLVGGIGIMDVMLVSVTERMHEIGIRKAIGATNAQIMSQFLTEATVLSVGGGIIGIIVSFIIDGLLRIFTDLQPIISWQIVLVAVGVSTLVGIIFGTAPAFKAARKDPIDALRTI